MGNRGDWREFDPGEVKNTIYNIADDVDLTNAQEFAQQAGLVIESDRSDVLSIVTGELAYTKDLFLESIKRPIDLVA